MNKQLIFVTGDKGGVGKTTTARLIADYLEKSESSTYELRFVDTDKTNATFKRFMGDKCSLLDLDKEGALDQLIDDIVEAPQYTRVVVDCAARSLDLILAWMDSILFENILSQHSIDLVYAFVLGGDKDSLQILNDLALDMKSFSIKAKYILVKNFGRSKDFSLFEGSNIRKALAAENASEITLEPLLERTSVAIDRANLRFLNIESESGLGVTDRQRAKTFFQKSIMSLEEAGL